MDFVMLSRDSKYSRLKIRKIDKSEEMSVVFIFVLKVQSFSELTDRVNLLCNSSAAEDLRLLEDLIMGELKSLEKTFFTREKKLKIFFEERLRKI